MPDAELLEAPGAGSVAARGGALRVGAYAGGQALAVLAAALLFRHLGVDGAGRYITVLSLVAVVQGLADVGLSTLAARQLALTGADEQRALMGRLLGLRLALAAAGALVALAFAVAAGYTGAMVAGVALAGVALAFTTGQGTLAVGLLVRLRAGTVAAAELARQGVGLALVAVLVAAGAGLVPFFAALIPATLAALVITASATGWVRPSARGWRALARDVAPFALAAAAGVLFFRVTVVQMSLLASDRQTGLFAASFRVVEVLSAIPPLLVGTAFPVLAVRAARTGLGAAVERTLEPVAALGVGIALALALGGGWVVRVVAGEDFAAAGDVLQLQGAALAASFIAAPWAYGLLALQRERVLAAVNVVGVVLALGVAAALIEAAGAEGAAGATVIGEAGLAVAFAVLLAREGVPLGLRRLAPVALAAAAGGAVALIPGLSELVRTLLGAAVYALVLSGMLARRGRR